MPGNKTLTFNYKLEFKRMRQQAFEYLRQINRRKEFMLIVDSTIITQKSSGTNLKGTRFKEITHFLGFDIDLEYEIVGFTEGKLIATKCNDGPFYPYMEIEVHDGDGDSSTADVMVTLNVNALRLMPDFILKPTIEAIIKRILKKLTDCISKEK